MATEVPINNFAISTVGFFRPEDAFRTADQINSRKKLAKPVDVEIHTTKKITPDFVRRMRGEYPLVSVSSVHLEVPFDQDEIDYQVFDQGVNNFHRASWSPLAHLLFYAQTGVASSLHGLGLTESIKSRVIDANLHINTLLGFSFAGQLDLLEQRRKSVTVENSVRHDYPYGRRPPGYTPDMMYDPRKVIEVMDKLGMKRFRLGLDHLTTYLDRQNITPHQVIDDETVKKQTVAVNLAGAGNGQIEYTDEYWDSLFGKIGRTDFQNHLKGVFTFSPLAAAKGAFLERGYANFYAKNISEVLRRQQN